MRVPLDDRAAALHDLLNTMFWPTMLLIFGRMLFPRAVQPIVAQDDNSRDAAIDRDPSPGDHR